VRILPGADPDIVLVPLFGHTRGHTGVAVKQGDGWLLHCGDTFFHRGEIETPPYCPPMLKAFQNLYSVENAARRSNSELFCSHDPVMLERMQEESRPCH
jgi:glyoxylase-like metal-dependent hydrolase (beta-lactamase superfamily II)